MVDPVLKRGMFNQGPVDPGPDFAAPMGPSFGTPKKEKSTNDSLSYPTPAIDGALGLMGLDPTLITNLVDLKMLKMPIHPMQENLRKQKILLQYMMQYTSQQNKILLILSLKRI